MFHDAVYHPWKEGGSSGTYSSWVGKKYSVTPIDLNPDQDVAPYTRGTGAHNVNGKYLVELDQIHERQPLVFSQLNQEITYTAKLYQLVNFQTGEAISSLAEAPNWFGVAVPKNVTDFSNVILYFHASPMQVKAGGVSSGWNDNDYPDKTGTGNWADWKELFGFVDRLGTQLAAAIEKYPEVEQNQIVIVPFMTTELCNLDNNGNKGNAGILTDHWYDIVNDIIKDLTADR